MDRMQRRDNTGRVQKGQGRFQCCTAKVGHVTRHKNVGVTVASISMASRLCSASCLFFIGDPCPKARNSLWLKY